MKRTILCCLIPALITAGAARGAQKGVATGSNAVGVEYFEKRVRPILAKACYQCHSASADLIKGGFTLDTKAGLLHGGDSGKPGVIAGDPKGSSIVRAVMRSDASIKAMPPRGALSPEQVS